MTVDHQREVGVLPPQRIIIHLLWFVLFSFHFHARFPIFHPLFSHILSLAVHTCPHISLSLPLLLASLFSGSGHQKSSSLSMIQLLSGHQHPLHPLPNPHSANLSPWNLSNSPCTHSAVPFISCSLHPPLLHFLALPALAT